MSIETLYYETVFHQKLPSVTNKQSYFTLRQLLTKVLNDVPVPVLPVSREDYSVGNFLSTCLLSSRKIKLGYQELNKKLEEVLNKTETKFSSYNTNVKIGDLNQFSIQAINNLKSSFDPLVNHFLVKEHELKRRFDFWVNTPTPSTKAILNFLYVREILSVLTLIVYFCRCYEKDKIIDFMKDFSDVFSFFDEHIENKKMVELMNFEVKKILQKQTQGKDIFNLRPEDTNNFYDIIDIIVKNINRYIVIVYNKTDKFEILSNDIVIFNNHITSFVFAKLAEYSQFKKTDGTFNFDIYKTCNLNSTDLFIKSLISSDLIEFNRLLTSNFFELQTTENKLDYFRFYNFSQFVLGLQYSFRQTFKSDLNLDTGVPFDEFYQFLNLHNTFGYIDFLSPVNFLIKGKTYADQLDNNVYLDFMKACDEEYKYNNEYFKVVYANIDILKIPVFKELPTLPKIAILSYEVLTSSKFLFHIIELVKNYIRFEYECFFEEFENRILVLDTTKNENITPMSALFQQYLTYGYKRLCAGFKVVNKLVDTINASTLLYNRFKELEAVEKLDKLDFFSEWKKISVPLVNCCLEITNDLDETVIKFPVIFFYQKNKDSFVVLTIKLIEQIILHMGYLNFSLTFTHKKPEDHRNSFIGDNLFPIKERIIDKIWKRVPRIIESSDANSDVNMTLLIKNNFSFFPLISRSGKNSVHFSRFLLQNLYCEINQRCIYNHFFKTIEPGTEFYFSFLFQRFFILSLLNEFKLAEETHGDIKDLYIENKQKKWDNLFNFVKAYNYLLKGITGDIHNFNKKKVQLNDDNSSSFIVSLNKLIQTEHISVFMTYKNNFFFDNQSLFDQIFEYYERKENELKKIDKGYVIFNKDTLNHEKGLHTKYVLVFLNYSKDLLYEAKNYLEYFQWLKSDKPNIAILSETWSNIQKQILFSVWVIYNYVQIYLFIGHSIFNNSFYQKNDDILNLEEETEKVEIESRDLLVKLLKEVQSIMKYEGFVLNEESDQLFYESFLYQYFNIKLEEFFDIQYVLYFDDYVHKYINFTRLLIFSTRFYQNKYMFTQINILNENNWVGIYESTFSNHNYPIKENLDTFRNVTTCISDLYFLHEKILGYLKHPVLYNTYFDGTLISVFKNLNIILSLKEYIQIKYKRNLTEFPGEQLKKLFDEEKKISDQLSKNIQSLDPLIKKLYNAVSIENIELKNKLVSILNHFFIICDEAKKFNSYQIEFLYHNYARLYETESFESLMSRASNFHNDRNKVVNILKRFLLKINYNERINYSWEKRTYKIANILKFDIKYIENEEFTKVNNTLIHFEDDLKLKLSLYVKQIAMSDTNKFQFSHIIFEQIIFLYKILSSSDEVIFNVKSFKFNDLFHIFDDHKIDILNFCFATSTSYENEIDNLKNDFTNEVFTNVFEMLMYFQFDQPRYKIIKKIYSEFIKTLTKMFEKLNMFIQNELKQKNSLANKLLLIFKIYAISTNEYFTENNMNYQDLKFFNKVNFKNLYFYDESVVTERNAFLMMYWFYFYLYLKYKIQISHDLYSIENYQSYFMRSYVHMLYKHDLKEVIETALKKSNESINESRFIGLKSIKNFKKEFKSKD